LLALLVGRQQASQEIAMSNSPKTRVFGNVMFRIVGTQFLIACVFNDLSTVRACFYVTNCPITPIFEFLGWHFYISSNFGIFSNTPINSFCIALDQNEEALTCPPRMMRRDVIRAAMRTQLNALGQAYSLLGKR
jgi:hypothetical protein